MQPSDFLALFLLIDGADPHSFFQPYHQSLPKTFDNFPALWQDAEIR
jgi:hypothetical protein